MKAKIIRCGGFGPDFEPLTPGSIHEIVETPSGEFGMWVKVAEGKAVHLLDGEYKIVED